MQHAGSPDDVYAMSTSTAFQERKCADVGALSCDVRVTTDGDTAVVRVRRKLPAAGFPTLVRRLSPTGVTATETVRWGAAQPDRSRTARLRVDFFGAPARLEGTIRLQAAAGGGSEALVDVDFTAPVPLLGGRLEKMAVPIITRLLEAEEATGRAWAAERA